MRRIAKPPPRRKTTQIRELKSESCAVSREGPESSPCKKKCIPSFTYFFLNLTLNLTTRCAIGHLLLVSNSHLFVFFLRIVWPIRLFYFACKCRLKTKGIIHTARKHAHGIIINAKGKRKKKENQGKGVSKIAKGKAGSNSKSFHLSVLVSFVIVCYCT